MTILAFLQNMWVKNPANFHRALERAPNPEHRAKLRRKMIEYALFAGCLTGRRLRQVFGQDLCEAIIWEEANPIVADNPRDYHPPDPHHITAVLREHRPEIVLTFTRRGEYEIEQWVKDWDKTCRVFKGPHPAARGPSTIHDLGHMNHQLCCALLPGELA